MVEEKASRGIVDTSVVIDYDRVDLTELPEDISISTLTLAELAAGPAATDDLAERAERQERLQWAEATFEPVPVDSAVARSFGRLYALALAGGRKTRGRRSLDLLIAATAHSAGLPLYTSNPKDFADLTDLVDIRAVHPAP